MGKPRLAGVIVLATLLAGCAAPAARVDLPDIHGLAIDPHDPSVLYVATHGGLFRAKDDTDWSAVTQEPFDMMGFTLEAQSGTMYASGHPAMGGLLGFARSTDRGQSWEILSLGGQVDFHAMTVSLAKPDRVWGYWRGDLMRSDDAGRTWQSSSAGVAPPNVASLASHATDPDTLFAATSQGVHVSRDGGATFEPLPSTPARFTAIATSPADPALVLAAHANGLDVSRDGALTWTTYPLGISADDAAAALAVHPTSAGTFYMGSYRGQIWKSVDGGADWTVVVGAA